MVVGVRTKSSAVLRDRKSNKIPGLAGLSLDQPGFLINTALTNIFGGASGNLINFLVPFDYKAVSAFMVCTVVPGTGAAVIGAGTTASTSGLLSSTVATNEVTTFQDLTGTTDFTGAALFGLGVQGDIIVFQTDGGGTTTGKAVWGLMIVPN